jgi:hypothetical protein
MADDLLMTDSEIAQEIREPMGIVIPVVEVKGAKQANPGLQPRFGW